MAVSIYMSRRYCDICNDFTQHTTEQKHYPIRETTIKCNDCGRLTTYNTRTTEAKR